MNNSFPLVIARTFASAAESAGTTFAIQLGPDSMLQSLLCLLKNKSRSDLKTGFSQYAGSTYIDWRSYYFYLYPNEIEISLP